MAGAALAERVGDADRGVLPWGAAGSFGTLETTAGAVLRNMTLGVSDNYLFNHAARRYPTGQGLQVPNVGGNERGHQRRRRFLTGMRRVYCDHRIAGEHPPSSSATVLDGKRPQVTEPDGSVKVYEHDEWHVGGETVVCGFLSPEPAGRMRVLPSEVRRLLLALAAVVSLAGCGQAAGGSGFAVSGWLHPQVCTSNMPSSSVRVLDAAGGPDGAGVVWLVWLVAVVGVLLWSDQDPSG